MSIRDTIAIATMIILSKPQHEQEQQALEYEAIIDSYGYDKPRFPTAVQRLYQFSCMDQYRDEIYRVRRELGNKFYAIRIGMNDGKHYVPNPEIIELLDECHRHIDNLHPNIKRGMMSQLYRYYKLRWATDNAYVHVSLLMDALNAMCHVFEIHNRN